MFLLKHVKPVIVSCRKNFLKSFVLTRCLKDLPYEDVSLVSSTIIKKSLNSHKISFEEGFTCFIVGCQICNKKDCGKARNVYINKSTGMFMCCLCKGTGQWSDFESIIGGKKKKTSNVESLQLSVDHVKLNESLKGIKKVTESVLYRNDLDSLSNKFGLPVISKHILKVLDIRIDESQQNLYFPLENITSEIVGYRRVNQETKEDSTLPDLIYGGLLIGKPSRNKDTAILVPNISDFISLFNAKLSQYVVCLPNGVNNLSQYVLPTLERFKTLILWFGDDLKSWDSARHFAKKLGEQRCLFIRPDSKNLLPHLVQDQDFKTIINSAQPIWHKSITNFASLRQDILSDLQNIDKVEGVKWKRYPALNKILKGHRRGELTVVTGPTGSGKTTFMSEYSLDLAMQGVNTLWGSFEIQNVRLARTMLQQLAGLPLDENLGVFDSWADKFELLPIYFMTFYGQQSIKVVMDAVEHATYVHDIAHVIIDNVQFMMGMNEEHKNMDRFWTQDVIIASFRNFATKQNCHVSLVIHPRKEKDQEDLTTSSIFGGAKASQEADNVLIIQDKRLTSVRGKKYLQVCKNRYSGDLGVMPLDFDKSSLSFVPKKRKEDKKESPEADTST